MKSFKIFTLSALLLAISACAQHAPMPTVDYVDINRFMGDWYVIANIPTTFEKGAHNAVETYELKGDDQIATTFTFRDGAFSGKQKSFHPKGFIADKQTNARWLMQFVWPLKMDYRIVYLTPDYSQTIIARRARDYVWLMARSPNMGAEEYQTMLNKIEKLGYDPKAVIRVPQQWPAMSE